MDWLYYIVCLAIIVQILFIVQAIRNHRYVLRRHRKARAKSGFAVALIVPCKGIDSAFEKNISSFYKLDYENFIIRFVVEDASDPAYEQLCRMKDEFVGESKALDVEILIAGRGQMCSQKLHNMLYAYRQIGNDVDVLAFADSDACVRHDWLSHLVYPLGKSKTGVASGYRWYVPQKNNLATLVLSAINAKIAQLLGATHFNLAWGGSMAVKVDVFRKLGMEKIWAGAISDDLTISRAAKNAGLKVAFVPACLVASYEQFTWCELFEFARRQFLITRVTMPLSWWFGLLSSLYSVLGAWGGLVLAIYAIMADNSKWMIFAAMPILFFAGQMIRSALRQRMIGKLLPDDAAEMNIARKVDLLGSCLWSWIMLAFIISSAFGRTICWRGIRYKLLGPTNTVKIE